MIQYPSTLLTHAVEEFAKLPGIGHKTALRLVLHLLRQEPERAIQLGESLVRLRREVKFCRCCYNISDTDVCQICSDPKRDAQTICVVENVKEVMIIEATRQFSGLYHVLGGIISLMEGITPQQLQIESLVQRVRDSYATGRPIREVILALSTTIDGDTTNYYIFKRLAEFPDLRVTTLARGVSVGDQIEYADEVTLGRSILYRTLYTETIQTNK